MTTAITGGIGSGKSFVCRLLEKRGINNIYDCDKAAKRLIKEDPKIKEELLRTIGQHAYENGKLNKAAVAEFLMESEANKRRINAIVHPAVASDFLKSGHEWMECAILYESGFDKLVDRVVAVSAPKETRIERIMARDNIDRHKAEEWIDLQLPQEEVERKADFVIINDGLRDLDEQLSLIIGQI